MKSIIGTKKTKVLSNCLFAKSATNLNVTNHKTYSNESKSTDAKTTASSREGAAAFEEMPSISPLKILIGFMPGGKYYNQDLDNTAKSMLAEKGDIVRLDGMFGKQTMVLTQNPNDFETVFRHDGAWPYRKGFEILSYHRNVHRKDFFGDKSGLLTSQGQDWGDFRTSVNPIIIHPKNVKVYLQTMSEINKQFIARIKTIRDPSTLEVPANFKNEISFWTLESVAVVALNQQLGLLTGSNSMGARFFDLLQRFFDLAVELEIKPSIWRYVQTPALKQAMAVLDECLQITAKYVEKANERQQQTADGEPSVLDKLMSIDAKVATVMAMDMLLAGVDTTTSTFTGLLLALAKNPEKQAKLRQEILKVLPHKDSPLTVENMKHMPYLRACIKESLRYYPLTQANVRRTQEELVLSGYRVPADTDVILVHLNLLRDPAHFSNPNAYIPERWLRLDKAAQPCPHAATKTSHPFAYLPFGFGARSCIGRRIAEMEIEIGITRLLRSFQVEFNYPTENAFKSYQINTPNIPLRFKFTDLPY